MKAYKLALRAYTNKAKVKVEIREDVDGREIDVLYRCGRCNAQANLAVNYCDNCGCEFIK